MREFHQLRCRHDRENFHCSNSDQLSRWASIQGIDGARMRPSGVFPVVSALTICVSVWHPSMPQCKTVAVQACRRQHVVGATPRRLRSFCWGQGAPCARACSQTSTISPSSNCFACPTALRYVRRVAHFSGTLSNTRVAPKWLSAIANTDPSLSARPESRAVEARCRDSKDRNVVALKERDPPMDRDGHRAEPPQTRHCDRTNQHGRQRAHPLPVVPVEVDLTLPLLKPRSPANDKTLSSFSQFWSAIS
jgi:hypothetical protein